MQISLAKFNPSQLSQILAIEKESFSKDFRWSRREILRFIQDATTTCITANVNNVVVGFSLFRRADRCVQIWDIVVDPENRRNGVGRLLMEDMWHCMCAGRPRQRRLVAVVGYKPAGTLSFFKAMGFHAVGLIEDGVSPGVDAYSMSAEPGCESVYVDRLAEYFNSLTREF